MNWKEEQWLTQLLLFLLLTTSQHKENTNETKEKETSRPANDSSASVRDRRLGLSIR